MENLINPDDFKTNIEQVIDITREVEQMKSKTGLNYIECVVEVCEKFELDIETIAEHLTPNIKEKIEADALKMNLLNYKINTLI